MTKAKKTKEQELKEPIIDRLAKNLEIPNELMTHPIFREDFTNIIYNIIFTTEFTSESDISLLSDKASKQNLDIDDIILNMWLCLDYFRSPELYGATRKNRLDLCINYLNLDKTDEFINHLSFLLENMPYKRRAEVRKLLGTDQFPFSYSALQVNRKDNSVCFQSLSASHSLSPHYSCPDSYTLTHYSIDPNGNLAKHMEYQFKYISNEQPGQTQRSITIYDSDGSKIEDTLYAFKPSGEFIYKQHLHSPKPDFSPPGPIPKFPNLDKISIVIDSDGDGAR